MLRTDKGIAQGHRFGLLFVLISALVTGCGGGNDWKDDVRDGGSDSDDSSENDDSGDDDDSGDNDEDTGSLTVNTVTDGEDLDTSYRIDVDGTEAGEVNATGRVTLSRLEPGERSILLADMQSNCLAVDENPRLITISANTTVETSFKVNCVGGADQGDVRVTTRTEGDNIDSDTVYTIMTNNGAQPSQSIGVQSSRDINGLAQGNNTLGLTDIPSHCTAANNPRAVNVKAGTQIKADFDVTCSASVGDLTVEVRTEGSDFEDNQYRLELDGAPREDRIEADGTVAINDIASGDHTLVLTEVDNHCTVADDNPRTVRIAANSTTRTIFEISCVADSRTGELTLTTTTAEDDGSPARFVAEMDGGAQRRRLNGDDQTSTDGLTPLDHTLLLTSVPGECIVNSENPTTITVSQDLRAAGAFATTCSTATGEVEVTISSNANFSGDLDSNGYKLLINGGAQRIDVPISGTRTVALSVDDTTSDRSREHELTLTDIAPNCVTTDNPRTVTVEQGASEPTTFTVNCFDRTQDTGTLQIQTSTTGEDPDSNGYLLRVDGGAQISSARTDGSVRLSGYAAGQHEIEITEVASNCRSNPTSQTVTVAAGSDSATATFEVECDPVDNTLEVRAATAGSTNKLNPNDYGLALDGTRWGNVTLEINGDQVILPNVSSGEHTVELLDLVDPCFVTNGSQGNDNPVITTDVPANGRGFVTFAVNCDEDDRPDS